MVRRTPRHLNRTCGTPDRNSPEAVAHSVDTVIDHLISGRTMSKHRTDLKRAVDQAERVGGSNEALGKAIWR